MKKLTQQEPYFTLKDSDKQFPGQRDVIWRVALLNIPINELIRAKLVCKEFYNFITKHMLKHPSWTQSILHQVGYNQTLTARLLKRNPDALHYETLFSENTRTHTLHFNHTRTVIQCGQLGLNVRDHQAPFYVVDAEHHITLFSYERGELLGSFLGHQHSLRPQTVISLDRETIASGDVDGNIFIWQPALIPREEPQMPKKTFAPLQFLKKKKDIKSSKAAPIVAEPTEPLIPFGKQDYAITAMARIDQTHFISADSAGVIQWWDTHKKFPLRTWETEDEVRALCYCNAQSVFYMTYDFTEQGFKHEFTVWQYDGTHKNLYYTHEYINAERVESLPRMLCYLTPGIGLFTDPTVAKNLIYHVMQPDEHNDSKKAKAEKGGYNYEKAVCSFFSPAGYVGIVNKGRLPSNYRVTLFEHLTKYSLPTEPTSSLIFK